MEFEGQPIAAVVAETRDQAKHAVRAFKVQYEELKPIITFKVQFYIFKVYFNIYIIL